MPGGRSAGLGWRMSFVGIIVAGACGWCPDPLYEIVTPEPVVQLPMDEAPHCVGGEWWYYTGELAAEDGGQYGIEAVIFHFPLLAFDVWMSHFAILDRGSGRFVYQQSRQTMAPISPGGDPPNRFDLTTSLIRMSGAGGHDHVEAAMPDGSYGVDLALTDVRGPILHGPGGYVAYGSGGHSFYYSRPQMGVAGTLRVNGQTKAVGGELWFDRQWGRDINNPFQTWDWFSLRLDDGSDVMLFVFRGSSPVVALGTYVPPTGERVELGAGDFRVWPIGWWTSPHTGMTYPVRWVVRVLPLDLAVTVSAVAEDQELDVRASTLNVYWEGLCSMSGTRAGEAVSGTAYVELTNYPVGGPEAGSGDMNCDGGLSTGDVAPFVRLLVDPIMYTRDYMDCDPREADTNGDGRLDGGDVAAFVLRLTGG